MSGQSEFVEEVGSEGARMTGYAGQAARQRGMTAPACAAGDLAWLEWRACVVKGRMVQGLEWCVRNGKQARSVFEVGLISSCGMAVSLTSPNISLLGDSFYERLER